MVLFFYNEKGFEQGGRKARPFGRKQSGGLFFADGGNEQSEAREATASEKSLASAIKIPDLRGFKPKSPIVFAIGLFAL